MHAASKLNCLYHFIDSANQHKCLFFAIGYGFVSLFNRIGQ